MRCLSLDLHIGLRRGVGGYWRAIDPSPATASIRLAKPNSKPVPRLRVKHDARARRTGSTGVSRRSEARTADVAGMCTYDLIAAPLHYGLSHHVVLQLRTIKVGRMVGSGCPAVVVPQRPALQSRCWRWISSPAQRLHRSSDSNLVNAFPNSYGDTGHPVPPNSSWLSAVCRCGTSI